MAKTADCLDQLQDIKQIWNDNMFQIPPPMLGIEHIT